MESVQALWVEESPEVKPVPAVLPVLAEAKADLEAPRAEEACPKEERSVEVQVGTVAAGYPAELCLAAGSCGILEG